MGEQSMKKARIIGLGSYLPARVLSNQDLEKIVDTTDEWITTRTGIKERRIAADDEAASDMGAAAGRKALHDAGLTPADVDLILVCTMTPDHLCPSTAAIIQHKLGTPHIPAFDMQAACTGFLYGLSAAKAYVESGLARHVLLIATEMMSSVMDYTDRATCVLFGDGAAAVVVSTKGKGLAIDTVSLGADGELGHLIIIPGGGSRNPTSLHTVAEKLHYFSMNGKEVFKHAVRRMRSAANTCLSAAGLTEKEISWIVPHQANIRILEALAKSFEIPDERVYKTIHKYGNTSGSGVAIALDELVQENALKKGEHLLLVAFGGGLTWGAAVLTQT